MLSTFSPVLFLFEKNRTMKTCFLLLSLFAAIANFAQTGDQTDTTQLQKPFIEVTGTAFKEVVPNKIYISIILSNKIINNQPYNISAQEDKLKKALVKNSIDLSNLSLSDATSEITTYKSKETGFKVTKEYVLLVSNATQVSVVFKELYAINIKEASIQKVERSDIETLRRQVRVAAIQAAKDKADYLLAAIGEERGKPLEVREQSYIPYFQNQLANTMLTQNESTADDNPEPTNFQKFTVKFSYYIKYAIK